MNVDRYLRIVRWARSRYTLDGVLAVSVGGLPSAYSRIERAAWDRYMNGKSRYNYARRDNAPAWSSASHSCQE